MNALHPHSAGARWVRFQPIDSESETVACNLATLEYARPALYIQCTRDPPSGYTGDGTPVVQTGFTKAQLAAFVSSFYVGRLMVTKDVDLDELLGIFEQQGVAFSWNKPLPNSETPTAGVAVRRGQKAETSLREACEQLANGFLLWDKIENVMDAALGPIFRPIPEMVVTYGSTLVKYNATSSRVWVRFCGKPSGLTHRTADAIVAFAYHDWPVWLERYVTYLGIIFAHKQLKSFNEKSFNELMSYTEHSPLQFNWFLKYSNGWTEQVDAVTNFVSGIRSRLGEPTAVVSAPHQPLLTGFQTRHRPQKNNDDRCFARAIATYAYESVRKAPDFAALFSGACADADGSTPERLAFAKAMAAHHVTVVRWSSDANDPRKPIIYPPYLRCSVCDTAAVLIDFSNR
jgi:hypothetical protein